MSDLSVNDHLEGILSDFEALKQSFEIEDVDDIPASPISSPISPTSSLLLLNHNKDIEGRGGVQSATAAFNNYTSSSAAYQSRINMASSPSPMLKSRTVVTSLSFNRGTMNKPAINNNNSTSGVTRAASFQNRFNPNGYFSSTLSGPGSDDDSLHSSSSSLEYSGSSGGVLPLAKPGPFHSPPALGEFHRPPPQLKQQQPRVEQQHLGREVGLQSNHTLKKFSSHGSVFHSEMEVGPGVALGNVPEPRGMSHGSMPSLDLQIGDGGGRMVAIQKGGGGMSPGLRCASANTNWNTHLHNTRASGKEGNCSSNNQYQQEGPQPPQVPQPKAKEIPRLNKFPLDLDNLVSSVSTTSTTKPQVEVLSPKTNRLKPPPASTGGPQYPPSPSSASASASPSPSLSSLDSPSETPLLSFHHPFSPFSQLSQIPSQGAIPVPEVSHSPVSLSPAQTPHLEPLSRPQGVSVAAASPGPSGSGPFPVRLLEDTQDEARESVGSILQRIASFSRPAATDISPATKTTSPRTLSNGMKRDASVSPKPEHQDTAVMEPTPIQRHWKNNKGYRTKQAHPRQCFSIK